MNLKVAEITGSVIGAIIFGTISVYSVYILFKNYEDEEDFEESADEEDHVIVKREELTLPQNVIGSIIGRQGANIKTIQKDTLTYIDFKDTSNPNERLCVIRGQPDAVEKAKKIVMDIVKSVPVFITEQISLHQKHIGRIIGRQGTTINQLKNTSGAKIDVDKRGTTTGPNTIITLRGSEDQVYSAKQLIIDIVKGDDPRSPVLTVCNTEEPEKKPVNSLPRPESTSSSLSSLVLEANSDQIQTDNLIMDGREHVVFMSAAQAGNHFWVQTNPQQTIKDLDALTEKMLNFYEKNLEVAAYQIAQKDLTVGRHVAALYPVDGKWYRGCVAERLPSEDTDKVPVFFCDYGETELLVPGDIRTLTVEFAVPNLKAVECYLAYTSTKSVQNGPALNALVKLADVSNQKPVTIKVEGLWNNSVPYVSVKVKGDCGKYFDVRESLHSQQLLEVTSDVFGKSVSTAERDTLRLPLEDPISLKTYSLPPYQEPEDVVLES